MGGRQKISFLESEELSFLLFGLCGDLEGSLAACFCNKYILYFTFRLFSASGKCDLIKCK